MAVLTDKYFAQAYLMEYNVLSSPPKKLVSIFAGSTHLYQGKVPFLLTFYVPNLGSRIQNVTSLAS